MRLGSATTKLLPIVLLFPSIAFPNPVFINPAFANGEEVSSQLPEILGFASMGPAGSGIAALDSGQTALPLGFSDVTSGQDYQLMPAGIGAGLSSVLSWPAATANTAPILLDFVAVPNFNFSQIQQGQITAVTLDYESAANSINRAFTFDYSMGTFDYNMGDPAAVPEPATVGLGALGLGVFGVGLWTQRKRA